MSDDSQIKIMQSLGIDYNPAINSTMEFQKTVGNLNKQLLEMKATAMESANDINNAFSSQLGNVDASFLKEYNKMFANIHKQNKPIEIKVETDKAEIEMQEFAKSMGIKLDKNLRENFKGLSGSMITNYDEGAINELAGNIASSYKVAMDKQSKQMQISVLNDSDDKAIYDYLNNSTLRLSESTLNAKKNVDGFNQAIRNLVKTSSDSGHSLDQIAQELEGMGIQGFGANTEDIAERMTRAVQTVRNGFVNLGQDVPMREIEQFTKESLTELLAKLAAIDYEAKFTAKSLDQVAKIESTEKASTVMDGIKASIKDLGVVTTKTFKDMNNEVYKYIDTYKNLEKGVNISDTYTKNDSGSFDFQGRIVNDQSVEMTYKSLQKAHGEALKMNAAYDDTIVKNHQLAKDSAWKQHFQDIGKSSDEIKKMNSHYADLEKSSAKAMNAAHSEALEMNKTRDAEIAKIKESSLEQMKAQAASVQQRVSTKGLSEEYGRQATMLRDQLGVIQDRLQTEGKLSAEEVAQTAQLKEQLELLRAQTRTAISDDITENPSTFGQEWERRSSWFLSGAMFYGTINAAKQASETIKDVEMGMVELSRVMDDSSFVFDDYRDNLLQLGVEYGQTFDNVQSIALRWAQSGYNVADSLELTQTSLLALNTAELDATNATESMIGIMAQWELQASDLALVMDKVNITADNYSITSQDLVDGMLRSSSAAKNMNMSLDETIGLLTVMREASGRTGKEVGNALNSILSYITRGKSIENLEGLGIQMFTDDTETQFRNAMDIFQDIHSKWDSLSMDIQDGFVASADEAGLFNEEMAGALGIQEQWNDVQKRDASQSAAGVHRRNYFIGMIERMSNVQGVLNGMVDAGGYSMAENAQTMETLEKKQESLKASAEALAVAIGDAGLGGSLTAMAQGGTTALNAINNMPKGMKDLLLGSMATFTAVKTLQVGMKTFGIELPGVTQMIGSLTSGTWSLTTALKAGGSGLMAFASANAPLLALSAAVGVIVAVTNATKKKKEEEAKAIDVSKENIELLKEQKQGLEALSNEYDALKSKEQNLTATAVEKQRLIEIQRELVDLYGVSITGIDAEGQAYSDSTDAIRDKIKAMEEEKAFEESKLETAVKSKNVKDVEDLEKNLAAREEILQMIVDADSEVERLQNALANKEKVIVSSMYGDMELDPTLEHDHGVLLNFIDQANQNLGKFNNVNKDINDAIQEGTQDIQRYLGVQARDITQQLSEDGVVVSDSTRFYGELIAKSLSQVPKTIYELSGELEGAIKSFASSDFEEWSKKYDEAMDKGDTAGVKKASEAISGLVNEFVDGKPGLNDFAIAMEDAFNGEMIKVEDINSMEQYNSILETLTDNFDDATAKISDYRKILDELDSKEGLSVQTKQNIISKHQQLRPYLADEQELRRQLIKIISNEEETQRDAYAKMLVYSEEFYNARIKGNTDLVESLNEYYNTDFGNFKSLAQAKGEVEVELVKQLSGIWAQYYNAIKSGDSYTEAEVEQIVLRARKYPENEALQAAAKSANEVLGILHKVGDMENAFNNIALELGGVDLSGVGSPKSKKTGSDPKSKTEENKALNEAIKLLEHKKRISEETRASIEAELAELYRINDAYAKTADERMNMAERIYSTEKRLRDRTLQDSISFMNDKKNFNEMSIEDEIAAWERVKVNQVDNIEAVKQATLNLYKLKNQVMIDSFNTEENTIKHLTKLTVLSTEQQIEQYKKLYEVKAKDLSEQQKRTENLFALQKQLMSEQQKKSKDIYDQRIEQIESETKARKDAQNDIIAGIEKELELLDRQEGEYDHDKKMANLREQLAYWEVRTSEDARKKVIDLKKQIDEAEHKREVDLKKQGLNDKKKVLEDEVTAIDDSAKEERDKLDKSYKLIENAFDDHSLNVVAMAEIMSKGAYDEWLNNYIIPLQNALADSDFGKADSIFGDLGGFIDNQKDYTGSYEGNINNTVSKEKHSANNAQIYNLANSIANLKKEYALGNNPDAPSFTNPLYEQLSKLSPTVSDYLRNNDYIKAGDYVKGLPKMHKGGKSLSYGAVEMMPGELTFPPDLSMGLERLFPLLSNLGRGNVVTESSSSTDNRKSIKIENLLRIDNNHMEDDVDERSLVGELKRQLAGLI